MQMQTNWKAVVPRLALDDKKNNKKTQNINMK